MNPIFTSGTSFPPLDRALKEPNGLLAMGGGLTPQRLLEAYCKGIFPWFNEGEPILWWSPDPRMVLFPDELRISRSLSKELKKSNYQIRTDHRFIEVMQACAAPRKGQTGTWIHPEMIAAYATLHEMKFAHSVEMWMDGELVGGLYGVALGQIFFGESMFSRAPNASKIAFVHLVKQVQEWGFGLIDCQVKTNHLASLGAREIPRAAFAQYLSELISGSPNGEHWCFEQ